MQTDLLRVVPARHQVLLGQIARFGAVGLFGFVVDTAVVYLLRGPLGLYGAGLISFVVAASCNWAIHRVWTFRGLSTGTLHGQWIAFLATNAVGFVLNRGAYVALVTFSLLAARNPVLATAGGAVAGMGVNFILSKRLVFR